ncbi:hypothetical protein PSCICJ_22010 [Pseudomonas cichorii]|nr:hypothetical protein PSCICJ_22010 [Pseudomonas cichorii]
MSTAEKGVLQPSLFPLHSTVKHHTYNNLATLRTLSDQVRRCVEYVPNPTGWVDPLGLDTCPG